MSNKISGLAIASMICGSLSMLCLGPLLGIPALIMGIIALKRIGQEMVGGKGMAITGIITGSLGTLTVVSLIMLLPALNSAREQARRISCASNLKQIGLALKLYARNYDDMLPPSGVAGLNILVKKDYLADPNVYVCPSSENVTAEYGSPLTEKNCSYVFIGDINEAEYPADMPIAYDKDGNHRNYVNFLFLDGHVKGYVRQDDIRKNIEYMHKCLEEHGRK